MEAWLENQITIMLHPESYFCIAKYWHVIKLYFDIVMTLHVLPYNMIYLYYLIINHSNLICYYLNYSQVHHFFGSPGNISVVFCYLECVSELNENVL